MLVNPLLTLLEEVKTHHDDIITDAVNDLFELDLIDFLTRFTICELDGETVFTRNLELKSTNSYFGKRSAMTPINVGVLDNDSIKTTNGVIIGKEVGTCTFYHYYNASVMFAGVLGELVSQMPIDIRKSDKEYYMLYKVTGFSAHGNLHTTFVRFFEKIH